MALESNDGLGVPALAENLLLLDVAGKNSTAIFTEPSSMATEKVAKSRPHKEKYAKTSGKSHVKPLLHSTRLQSII